MRLLVDDEIYNVNAVWLGPPRKTLPWRAPDVADAVGAAVFVVLQMVHPRLGVGPRVFTPAYSPPLPIAPAPPGLAPRRPPPPLRAGLTRFLTPGPAPPRPPRGVVYSPCP